MATTTTLAWAAFVVAATIIVRRQQQEVQPLLSPEPFPWEPNSSSPPSPLGKHQTTTNAPNAEEQLQFLACMTFANGGLRLPSCPCCQ